MKPNDNFEETIRQKLSFTASDNLHDSILNDVLNAQEQFMKTQSAESRPNIRRIIMTSPVIKLAAAAVIVVAILAGINQFGDSATGVVWGEVLGNIESAPGFIYRMRQIYNDKETGTKEFHMTVYGSPEYGMRMDGYLDPEFITQTYATLSDGMMTSINHQNKTYTRTALANDALAEIENMEPKAVFKQYLSAEYTKLGQKTIEGIKAEGIKIDNPSEAKANFQTDSCVIQLWVAVDTCLPILVETETIGKNGSLEVRTIQDNFQWDIELAESTCKPDIPGDYIGVDENNVAQLDGPRTHTFHDGSTVTLADGAKIKWFVSPDQRGFEHLAGAIEVTVAKGDGEFVVTTPYGEVKALGTKFSLKLVDGKDANTREQIKLLTVEVEEGSVQVSNAKGSSILKASRKLVVESEQKPYDYYQDENLPARLRERIQSMLEALTAGDSAVWMANYNIDYMYKLIKGQVEYDSNLFGGSKADAERLQKMCSDINSPQELLERFTAMGGIKKTSGAIFVRSVTLNENGDHAIARCIESAGENHILGHNPQWHFFDNDWWQIDD
jgi:hypothetical protein